MNSLSVHVSQAGEAEGVDVEASRVRHGLVHYSQPSKAFTIGYGFQSAFSRF
ncbi:hypothetical protein [Pseudomonas sp. RIT-PI-q]|jgi:hypothetical protein|uniref:hypothetical protein n=1 Tax=Pseudomonas sp. RIT-PI-q TaxID=1690247 RepID=UPI001364C923|nr:hypothetical protein [Pseudomonas sp. RIT-PI-q]